MTFADPAAVMEQAGPPASSTDAGPWAFTLTVPVTVARTVAGPFAVSVASYALKAAACSVETPSTVAVSFSALPVRPTAAVPDTATLS